MSDKFSVPCFSIAYSYIVRTFLFYFLLEHIPHATINMRFAYFTGCQAFFMTLILMCVTYYILYVELRRTYLFHKHNIESRRY